MTELEFEKWYEGRKSMHDEVIDILESLALVNGSVIEDVHTVIDAIKSIDISKGYKVEE
jgi:hypothetical protein